MQFSGKSVIITGAGKGIGRACAQLMAARGAEVVAISRTQSDLDSLKSDIGKIDTDRTSADFAFQAVEI